MWLHVTMTRNAFFQWICNASHILDSIHFINYKYTCSAATKILIPQPQKSAHKLQINLQTFCYKPSWAPKGKRK